MCETIVSCFEYWQDVRLPQQLQRAMAAEAEATREARAKVVAAEGEQKSSKALKEAADIISQSPSALQLRYLQVTKCVANQTSSIFDNCSHRYRGCIGIEEGFVLLSIPLIYIPSSVSKMVSLFVDPEFNIGGEELNHHLPSTHGGLVGLQC